MEASKYRFMRAANDGEGEDPAPKKQPQPPVEPQESLRVWAGKIMLTAAVVLAGGMCLAWGI